jgi:UDP-N-acetylglucosamine enolpyruvyl transferase
MEKIIGPTEIQSSKPSVNPLIIASIMSKNYLKIKNLFQIKERGVVILN